MCTITCAWCRTLGRVSRSRPIAQDNTTIAFASELGTCERKSFRTTSVQTCLCCHDGDVEVVPLRVVERATTFALGVAAKRQVIIRNCDVICICESRVLIDRHSICPTTSLSGITFASQQCTGTREATVPLQGRLHSSSAALMADTLVPQKHWPLPVRSIVHMQHYWVA